MIDPEAIALLSATRRPPEGGILRRPSAPVRLMLVAALLGALSFLLVRVEPRLSASEEAVGASDLNELRQPMLDILRAHYYRDVDESALLAAPVEQWPTLLDDTYTHILKPKTVEAQNTADSGHYVGIGVHAHAESDRIVIDAVFDGSPAAGAGIQSGDELTTVDGRRIAGLELEAALDLVRGPAGTTVVVTTTRAGSQISATIERREVSARLVWPRLVTVGDRQVGVITVVEFDDGVGDQVRAAAEDLSRDGAEAIALDLRHNPGGLVAEAVEVAGVFLPKGSTVLIEQGRHMDEITIRTRTEPTRQTAPLAAVLIDSQSASSSEVVAGALRDNLGTPLVGHRTFGKGVIQDIYPLPGGAALKATFAEYVTPAGQTIDRVGLAPDIESAFPETVPVTTGNDQALESDLAQVLSGSLSP